MGFGKWRGGSGTRDRVGAAVFLGRGELTDEQVLMGAGGEDARDELRELKE